MSEDRLELTLRLLRRKVKENVLPISADERVSEVVAAGLLLLHPDTLRRLRGEGSGPMHFKIGVGGSKVSYRLIDLAIWLEGRREISA